MKNVEVSIKELVPMIAKEYAIITKHRGFEETYYIHPECNIIECNSIDMSHYPKINLSTANKCALIKLAIVDILIAAYGFISEDTLIKYVEEYLV